MNTLPELDRSEEEVVDAIDAVGDPTRKQILGHLRKIDYLYNIASEFRISTSTVKHHLDILLDHGLIKQVGSGNYRKLYQITEFGQAIYNEFDREERSE